MNSSISDKDWSYKSLGLHDFWSTVGFSEQSRGTSHLAAWCLHVVRTTRLKGANAGTSSGFVPAVVHLCKSVTHSQHLVKWFGKYLNLATAS